MQPIYRAHAKERFPVAEMLSERGLYLPSAPTLSPEDIAFVVRSLKEIQRRSAT
jgi:dTDP-4-amino-4,6-dideoxygalactose transaminase